MTERISTSRESAELRHTLRTPINHMIGYAELLLEDSQVNREAEPVLTQILATAQQILGLVQGHLQNAEPDFLAIDLDALRRDLIEPVSAVIAWTTDLTRIENGSRLLDVERIKFAAGELLSFAQGGAPNPRSSSPLPVSTQLRETGTRIIAKFLIIDDSDLSREMLCRLLERQGHTCVALGSGGEALERLRSEAFDLVLLDMVMPGMNGLSVLEAIKSDETLKETPVVMLSAFDEVGDIGLCLKMGAEDYLLKPFDKIVLHARLNAVLERQRLVKRERERTLQLELADAELRRSNDELRRFASVVSHDLQEPLRMVTTYMQLLQRDLGEQLSERQREFLDFAIDGGRRMSALIQDLLSYSRVTSAQAETEVMDCNRVLEEVISTLRQSIEEAGARIENGGLPNVTADRSQIRQLFQNLLSNAIKYRSEKPPVIEVTATKQEDEWLFVFADNGVGIDKKYCDRVFEMFSRLHDRNIPGTGIGLAICQRVVDRLGGRIWVESQPGQGSKFYFTIPV